MDDQPCFSVGLGGDGDEIDAIEDVEREFGIVLDTRLASEWRTAGDVFAALMNSVLDDVQSDPSTWDRFAKALSGQTGVDPARITRDSLLLLPRSVAWARVEETFSFILWGVIALSLLTTAAYLANG